MKKYSFRLQTVLEMREKTLEDKRKEMAIVVSKLNEQLSDLEKLAGTEDNIKKNIDYIFNGGKELDILEVTNYKDYLGKVIVDIKNQEQIIQKTRYLLKFKQYEVQEALKALKVLEKLKEKQERKFYQNYEQMQAKELDDIATTRYKKVLI